ncbi:SEC-C domain-containing protein [Alkalithermobacter paradoxus]
MGRNDQCICGSGKKYKKCCLNKEKKISMLRKKIELSQSIDTNLINKIYNYSTTEELHNEFLNAQEKFFMVKGLKENEKFHRLFNTYYMNDYITTQNKPISILFYEQHSNEVSVVERDILKEKLTSYIGIYEVVDIKEDKALLKDVLTNEETHMEDLSVIDNVKTGEIIVGRIAKIVNVNRFLDVVVSISQKTKERLVDDITKIYNGNKDNYKDIKQFMMYNTLMMYKYIQQLLEPKIVENFNAENIDVEKCEIKEIILENIEAEYVEESIRIWNEYKRKVKDIKGNGKSWAAAIEYHVKKENGVTTTQSMIANKYGIGVSTLGKRYKEFKEA